MWSAVFPFYPFSGLKLHASVFFMVITETFTPSGAISLLNISSCGLEFIVSWCLTGCLYILSRMILFHCLLSECQWLQWPGVVREANYVRFNFGIPKSCGYLTFGYHRLSASTSSRGLPTCTQSPGHKSPLLPPCPPKQGFGLVSLSACSFRFSISRLWAEPWGGSFQ